MVSGLNCAHKKLTQVDRTLFFFLSFLQAFTYSEKFLAEGRKLLVVPQAGSHWLSMCVVLEKLWERGHEIVAVTPDATLLMKNSQSFTIKTYSMPYTQEIGDRYYHSIGEKSFDNPPFLEKFTFLLSNISELINMFSSTCRHLLYDELMKYLCDSKSDAVMMDPVLPCGPVVAEYLSLPSVYFMRGLPCTLYYKATQHPSPFSYMPRTLTSSSDHMTFTEHVKNLLYWNCFSKASIWLMRYDFVFVQCPIIHALPCPIMPNMVYIGGINCEQEKPLSKVINPIFTNS
ncbi:hypothetical protein QYF61_026408 [Mycteria americana]|uniref:glucuronosyltransferase n=1 Tax=Mycteria americana TaxID=33587 RepID=A0AAN7NVB1_MYCAM|nr:hypothetical protein QYF61_026408 [Mycteria americana]